MTTDQAATFAFVDLAGGHVGDAQGGRGAAATLLASRARVEACLGPDDALVKAVGDAVLLRFAARTGAVIALQELLRRAVADGALTVPRVGAHHGPAVGVEGEYYGAAVNLASRVAGRARAGQLLVTGEVAAAARSLGAVVQHAGSATFRNLSGAVDLWDIGVGR